MISMQRHQEDKYSGQYPGRWVLTKECGNEQPVGATLMLSFPHMFLVHQYQA